MTNKKKGLLIGCAPILGLFAIFVIYAIINFVFSIMGFTHGEQGTLITVINSLIAIIMSFLGIVCVLGIPVGIGVGIYYTFVKK